MFWLDNLQELTYPVLIPNNHMTFEEKLNAVIRLIIFVGIMATLIFNDSRYILFVIIIMIVSIVLYNYQEEKKQQMEKYLNDNTLDIIDNKKCVKPSLNNPFMNPNISDIKYSEDEQPNACSIENREVQTAMKKFFYSNVFRETDDIYDKKLLERQFYTMPSTSIPNEREKLSDWLYNRGPSCKENNGIQCYNNLFNDLKNSSHF
jgi:hypothetical protein